MENIAARKELRWSPASKKAAIVRSICIALKVHAALEEEIFYPAISAAGEAQTIQTKNIPEHDEMTRLIGSLEAMSSSNSEFEGTFLELIRDVLHHVADEETRILPLAERLLAPELNRLGVEMARRRAELLAPYLTELVPMQARIYPVFSGVAVGLAVFAGLTGGLLLGRNRRA